MNIEQLIQKINNTQVMKDHNCKIVDSFTSDYMIKTTLREPLTSLAQFSPYLEMVEILIQTLHWIGGSMPSEACLEIDEHYVGGMNNENYDQLVYTAKYLSMMAFA